MYYYRSKKEAYDRLCLDAGFAPVAYRRITIAELADMGYPVNRQIAEQQAETARLRREAEAEAERRRRQEEAEYRLRVEQWRREQAEVAARLSKSHVRRVLFAVDETGRRVSLRRRRAGQVIVGYVCQTRTGGYQAVSALDGRRTDHATEQAAVAALHQSSPA